MTFFPHACETKCDRETIPVSVRCNGPQQPRTVLACIHNMGGRGVMLYNRWPTDPADGEI
eukprot:220931-Hanusia_phi.AAC.2